MSLIEEYFSPRERADIEEAVARAEARTSGEVVPYVVPASGSYDGAVWRGATLLGLLAVIAAGFAHPWSDSWGSSPWSWGVLPTVVGVGVGLLAGRWIPAWRRWMAPQGILERQVELRAAAAFVDEAVFQTRDHTGVLLFVSLFEHRVVVLADAGIHAQVDQAQWNAIARDLADGIRAGRMAPALITAIDAVGGLLEKEGVERREDDENELKDGVRVGPAPGGRG